MLRLTCGDLAKRGSLSQTSSLKGVTSRDQTFTDSLLGTTHNKFTSMDYLVRGYFRGPNKQEFPSWAIHTGVHFQEPLS